MHYDDWYELNWPRLNDLYAAAGGDELCLEEFYDFCENVYENEKFDEYLALHHNL